MAETPKHGNSELSVQTAQEAISDAAPVPPPFSMQFLDRSPAARAARAIYFKVIIGGTLGLSIIILCVCSIYWGSVWNSPHHTLPGWIVDFDGGLVGQAVAQALSAIDPGVNGISWQVVSASKFTGGVVQLEDAIVQEETWYGLAINAGSSANLTAAISSANATYNSSTALTFIGSQARNENIYHTICQSFALQIAKNVSAASNAGTILASAPQIVTRPIGYTVNNVRPFDVLVASAVTFVGLIYLLILSFFIVMIVSSARLASGLEARLTLGSLIRVRLATSFVVYFWISFCYTMLSRAFQLPFSREFGPGGIVIFWMLNWAGMLACGLALEAMITLLTVRFIPFFLIIWIISNVSVSIFPLQVLPHVYRYGYAWPFYNLSRAVRTIVFRTKNDVGLNFGVLIAWIAVSCVTLPLFQWLMHRRALAAQPQQA
ncbi:hypothetical protein DFH07DRAFT_867947 [Mycena maculata]|uniref:DUF3533 domain-containing protein n=1 Tax=Mycena maculata TaxID=230809 RepID=A0AAD7J7M7_9AGAR|nr:hypothetical protein DFH07DRAFT_867947 [Mycena maculata]